MLLGFFFFFFNFYFFPVIISIGFVFCSAHNLIVSVNHWKCSEGWQWLLRKCNVSFNLSVSFDNVFLLILFLTYTVIPNILNKDVRIVNALSLSDFQLWRSSFCASNEEEFCTLIKMHFPSNRALPDFCWVTLAFKYFKDIYHMQFHELLFLIFSRWSFSFD